MSQTARRIATYDDILALPEHVVGEIIDGELIASPRPAPRHARVAFASARAFGAFDGKTGGPPDEPGGWWILGEPELHLYGGNILVPDLAGWRRERLPALPDKAWFDLPPDWVCEIVSPGSGRRDRIQKARIYRECLVEWMWLVDPAQQLVEVWHAETGRWMQAGGWGGDDLEARIPPFDAVAIDLSRWWDVGDT